MINSKTGIEKMKNLIIALMICFIAFFFYICFSVDYELQHPKNATKIVEKEKREKDFFDISVIDKLKIVMIDDCEYIYGCIGGMDGMLLTHKGNCKNPEHKGSK